MFVFGLAAHRHDARDQPASRGSGAALAAALGALDFRASAKAGALSSDPRYLKEQAKLEMAVKYAAADRRDPL